MTEEEIEFAYYMDDNQGRAIGSDDMIVWNIVGIKGDRGINKRLFDAIQETHQEMFRAGHRFGIDVPQIEYLKYKFENTNPIRLGTDAGVYFGMDATHTESPTIKCECGTSKTLGKEDHPDLHSTWCHIYKGRK